ncbi:polysaccharide deacetylase family protein [Thiotrichales bacterium 19S3-7]|nr:polysaccharide deacetylase family protein [Thiotrichales bacterium 19S3-7]MCF6800976.1 polysaccharide deacetylase family protein [Thiotrichales bacterium 19S3-11]
MINPFRSAVTVLMYHHVLEASGFICSSIDEFDQQMAYLVANNYKTLSIEEFYRFKKGELKLPKKSVLITFDDGWRNNFVYAYPILKKYGLKATLFVVTGWIEAASNCKDKPFLALQHKQCKEKAPVSPREVLCTWNELKKMRDVFDIQAHTHTHRDNYFDQLDWREDIIQSRVLLKARLGVESKHLCWPRGNYNEDTVKLAKAAGFEVLYTTERGVNLADNKLDQIKRIAVKKDARWLRKTIKLFSNAYMGSIYAKLKR